MQFYYLDSEDFKLLIKFLIASLYVDIMYFYVYQSLESELNCL